MFPALHSAATALALAAVVLGRGAAQDAGALAGTLAKHVKEINEAHVRAPGKNTEADLAKKLPSEARSAIEQLLKVKAEKAPDALADALVKAANEVLDLDLVKDFERMAARIQEVTPSRANDAGIVVSRQRFLLRGVGGVDPAYLARFADVLDAVLDAYEKVFSLTDWSKVPGKKLRVRVHFEPHKAGSPHFAPEFPFHSEVDFPVDEVKDLRSPTKTGRFLFYGLCHELGHVIAMWGDLKTEQDHHAWAHYTGVAIVEHLSKMTPPPAAVAGFGDSRARSIEAEKKRIASAKPSLANRDDVLALLIALHEQVGPEAIGKALNALDRSDRCKRINHVRYHDFANLRAALLEGAKTPDAKKKIEAIMSGVGNR